MDNFNDLYIEKNSKQLITVTPEAKDSSDAKIICYERRNNQWVETFNVIEGKIGKNGVTENKAEGDTKTPVGVYSFGIFFGSENNIGFKFPYKKVSGNEFWVDDIESKYYNTWQEGSSNGKWNSAENLLHPAYKYAAVINYNSKCIKGKGSAIFLHKINKGATQGCIAINEEELVKVLKWLDPDRNPLIVINKSSN
ncbi:MAG: L,D-transpeptidase family protein [Clostridium sp.]|nr:L,D-transpeptidase family protein [Clostridium sp.]